MELRSDRLPNPLPPWREEFRHPGTTRCGAPFWAWNERLNKERLCRQIEARGSNDDAFVLKMLEPLRTSRIWQPGESPDGITDVRFHRVIVSSGKDTVGVEFRAGK